MSGQVYVRVCACAGCGLSVCARAWVLCVVPAWTEGVPCLTLPSPTCVYAVLRLANGMARLWDPPVAVNGEGHVYVCRRGCMGSLDMSETSR